MIYNNDIENMRLSLAPMRNQLHYVLGIGTGITHSNITKAGLVGYQLITFLPYYDQNIIDRLPSNINGYQVVYEIGQFDAICSCQSTENHSCNCTSDCQGQFSQKLRPLQSGGSIGSIIKRDHPCPGGTSGGCCDTGTIGGFPKLPDGTPVLLSNNHVIGNDFPGYHFGAIGDNLVQPGTLDNGDIVADIVGTLQKKITIADNSTGNKVDAAYGFADPSIQINYTGLCNYQTNATVAPVLNMNIKKAGRTTGCTTGTITAIDVNNITVDYANNKLGAQGRATFNGQIKTSTNFTKAGDSGSVVVTDDGNNNAVGLLFAANSSTGSAILNVMSDVEAALGASFGTSSQQCAQLGCSLSIGDTTGQLWKCTSPGTCVQASDGTFNTQADCLESAGCQTTSTHKGCVDGTCQNVDGTGDDECSSNTDCSTLTHYACVEFYGVRYCTIDPNGPYTDYMQCYNACQ